MKERKFNISTDGESSPTLEDMVRQITPDNIHPTMDEGEVGQEVTEHDEDEELKSLIKDRLDQPEVEIDIGTLN